MVKSREDIVFSPLGAALAIFESFGSTQTLIVANLDNLNEDKFRC